MKHKLDYLSIYLKIAPRRVSPFLRAEQTAVSISVENKTIEVEQECSTSGISGVVWDCGLLMVDILDSVLHSSLSFPDMKRLVPSKTNKCLDLGCGTGVVGVACALLGFDDIVLTDGNATEAIKRNIERLGDKKDKCSFVEYKWGNSNGVPIELTGVSWDVVICSDVLYEKSSHIPLLEVLESLRFDRMFMTYKRRHDDAEKGFLTNLCARYLVEEIDWSIEQNSWIIRQNSKSIDHANIHFFYITPLPTRNT